MNASGSDAAGDVDRQGFVGVTTAGQGLGLTLKSQFIELLRRRFDVSIALLKPFPLQFQSALPPKG